MTNRQIKYVRFQTSLFVPGSGDVGLALPNPGRHIEFKAISSTEGVLLTMRGRETIVPWANVVIAELGEEIGSEPKAVKAVA